MTGQIPVPAIEAQMSTEVAVVWDVDVVGLDEAAFQGWITAVTGDAPVSVAVRVVNEEESRRLNAVYRGKDRPTNVLSFPAELPGEVLAELPFRPLGDLVICAPLVAAESREQGKPERDHWAHLTVHGVLHLQGHDHETDAEATVMEALEIAALATLGVPDPYATER
jgi:probable rRNA maturation factor